MTAQLLGLEGSGPADTVLLWGTAVLGHGSMVVNPVTGYKCGIFDLTMLASQGHVTLLDRFDVREDLVGHPLVAAAIKTSHPDADLFLRDHGKMSGVVAFRRQKNHTIYVFQNQVSFDIYANDVVEKILFQIFFEELDDEERRRLVRLALIARSDHPHAQAVRSALSKRPEVSARIARALFRSDADRSAFDDLFEAMTSTDTDYGIHYSDAQDLPEGVVGPTKGGGFDIGNAVKALRSLNQAHRSVVRPSIEKSFPFLNRHIPDPRFRTMDARSAQMHFSTNVPGESLGVRIGRHLSVRRLEKILRGDVVAGVDQSVAMEMVAKVAQPMPWVMLTQTPLGGKEERVYTTTTVHTASVVMTELQMLAVQSGQVDDAARVEIHCSGHRKLLLSTKDNGRGGRPGGVEYLRATQSALWQPLVATLERRVLTNAKEEFYLLNLAKLPPGSEQFTLNSAPSSAYTGAFISGLNCKVHRALDGTVVSTLGLVGRVPLPDEGDGSGYPAMQELFLGWDAIVKTCELKDASLQSLDWHAPVTESSKKAFERIIWAVGKVGGRAPLTDILSRIHAEFGKQVRKNNTVREVVKHPDLMKFEGRYGDEVELSEAGLNYYRIMSVVQERIEVENFVGAPVW